jgi:hypothetical protein
MEFTSGIVQCEKYAMDEVADKLVAVPPVVITICFTFASDEFRKHALKGHRKF